MKNLLILLLVLAVITLVVARVKPEWVPFLVGTPLLPDAREEVPLQLPQPATASADAAPPMYRWTDAKGVIQLSDKPPVGIAYETLRYHPDTNVIPAPTPTPEPPR
jgi:hypothetical protein